MLPPVTPVRLTGTCRLVPSLYPSEGILDRIAAPDDLAAIIELESWTNDRVSTELGILHRLPKSEWVTGKPMSSVVMAAYCHPRPTGGRFNSPDRGAWYAATTLDAAHAEVIYHRTRELTEIGVLETRVQMRLYTADFHTTLSDIRANVPEYIPYHDPVSYTASQALAAQLLTAGANGIIYRSVRQPGGECVACFRPKLVKSVRPAAHFEYRWTGTPTPDVRRL